MGGYLGVNGAARSGGSPRGDGDWTGSEAGAERRGRGKKKNLRDG